MAKTKSILSGKAKGLLKKNKKSGSGFKVDLGGGGFPAGIEFGTAKITKMEVGEYKSGSMKGKNYFMVRGVCISPKTSSAYTHRWSDEDNKSIEHDLGVVTVKGLQDSLIMEPLCDTPNRKRATEEEHYNYMFGILEGLGIDMSEIEDDDDLVAAFEAIIEEGKTVSFRTWSGEASAEWTESNVNISITGFGESEESDDDDDDDDMEVDDDDDDDPEEEEDDDTSDEEDEDDDDEDEEEDSEEEEEDSEEEDVPFGDEIDMIVDDCNDDDSKTQEKSQKKLVQMAQDAGIEDPEDEDEFPTWESVGAKIRELSEGDDEDEEDDEPEVPEKGQVVKYKPSRGKLGSYTVTSVNRRKQIVALKNKAGKIYKEVPFDKLS